MRNTKITTIGTERGKTEEQVEKREGQQKTAIAPNKDQARKLVLGKDGTTERKIARYQTKCKEIRKEKK